MDYPVAHVMCNFGLWSGFYFTPGITSTGWLADRGYDYDDDYSMLVHSELMAYLGLSKYLMEEECSILSDVYSGDTNGWKQGN